MTQGTSRHDPADPTLPLDPDEDAAWRALLARAVIVVPQVLDADLIEGALNLNLAEYIALVELSRRRAGRCAETSWRRSPTCPAVACRA